MGAQRIPIDPDVGIPDLVHRLTDDSKRLMRDEVRLAKLEIKDHVGRGGHGVLWLAVAFGIGVIAMVAFTLCLATLIGRRLRLAVSFPPSSPVSMKPLTFRVKPQAAARAGPVDVVASGPSVA